MLEHKCGLTAFINQHAQKPNPLLEPVFDLLMPCPALRYLQFNHPQFKQRCVFPVFCAISRSAIASLLIFYEHLFVFGMVIEYYILAALSR